MKNLDQIMKNAVYGEMEKGSVLQSIEIGKTYDAINKEEVYVVNFGTSQMPPNQLMEEFGYGGAKWAGFLHASFINGKLMPNAYVETVKSAGRFVPDRRFLAVQFHDTDTAAEILSGILWLRPNGFNPLLISERKEGNRKVYRNLITDTEYKGVAPNAKNGFRGYVFFKATPAEVRTNSCVLVDISKEGIEVVDKMLDKLTYGASSILAQKELDAAKLIKGFARLGMWGTYSRSFGKVNSYVIVDKFAKDDACDGIIFARAAFIQAAVKERLGITIPEKDLVGYCFRARPGMAKAMAVTIDDWMMESLERFLSKKEGWKKIGNGIPDFIADRNAWKADLDYARDLDFRVLAPMARMKDTTLNIQILAKIVNAPEFVNIIKEGTERLKNEHFWFASENVEAKSVSLEQFGANAVYSQLLMSLAPEFATKFPNIRFNALETAATAALKAAHRFNLPLNPEEARTLYLAPDFGTIFENNILEENEVFSRSLPETDIVGIRVPSVHPGEFEMVKGVSYEAISNRIDNANIKGWQKKWLKRMFKSLSKNMVVIPPTARFKALGGGLDFDTDTMMFMWNELIVSAFKTRKQQALDAEKPAFDDGKTHKLDHAGRVHAYVQSISSGSNQIGIFVHALTRIIEASSDPRTRTALLKELFGQGTKKYEARFVGDRCGDSIITVKEAEEALNSMKGCNLNDKETVDAMYNDLYAVFKSWADRVIDAAKTGDKIKLELPISRIVGSDLFSAFTLNIDPKNKDVKVSYIKNDKISNNGDMKPIIAEGMLTKAKKYIVREIAGKVKSVLTEASNLDQSDINMVAHVMRKYPKLANSLITIKQIYGDIVGLKRADLENFEDHDSIVAKSRIAWAKEFYAAASDMLRNICRAHGVEDPTEIAALALGVAMTNAKGFDTESVNSMPTVLAGPEMLVLARKYNYITTEEVSTEIFVADDATVADGDVLEFKDGFVRHDGAIIASCRKRINGKYAVKQENGSWFAVAKIDDLITALIPNGGNRVVLRVKTRGYKQEQLNQLVQAAMVAKEFRFVSGMADGKGDRLVGNNIEIPVSIEGTCFSQFLNSRKLNLLASKSGVVNSNGRAVNALLFLLEDTNMVENAVANVVEDDIDITFEENDSLF